MNGIPVNKSKIINDPVYGFINIPYEIVFDLIEHPYFQRLRNIRQLGLTNFVYPGANHTRFQHAIGAMHLMSSAISVIRSKGHEITEEEAEAVTIAILLHDIGHGPFSHALENSIIEKVNHEVISLFFMHRLNDVFGGRLEMAIRIFRNEYPKKFLHQLVSSQLDMDRLDYLNRDSFFTGVVEGVIGSERIIKMLNVCNDQLVIDIKGIYSIEKFLVSRRLMYWQVYFHKTVISAENLLLMVLKRAKHLAVHGEKLFASPAFNYFLEHTVTVNEFGLVKPVNVLDMFSHLDDCDIMTCGKVWMTHPDKPLALLSEFLTTRKLFRIVLKNTEFDSQEYDRIINAVMKKYDLSRADAEFLVTGGVLSNYAYNLLDDNIKILLKDGRCIDISEASDMLNPSVLSRTVNKYFICYPKEVSVS